MRFPRSIAVRFELYGASVDSRVVGRVGMTATPDHADTGSGEEEYALGVSFAAVDGARVDLFGPGTDVPGGVFGHVHQGGCWSSADDRAGLSATGRRLTRKPQYATTPLAITNAMAHP
jgi:hypothetical protein